MGRRLAWLLLLLPLSGCTPAAAPGADSPAAAAAAFHRRTLEGELSAAADYLADEDVALWADGRRAGLYGVEEGGQPGFLVESARLRSRRGDTVYVDVVVSGPGEHDRRWHRAMDSLYQSEKDPARIMEEARRLRRILPLERTIRTVPVLLQDGSWRVSLGLRVRERLRRLADGTSRWPESPHPQGSLHRNRLRAATAYLALADSYPALADTSDRRGAADMVRMAPYVDSVEMRDLTVLPGSSAWNTVRGTARNLSAMGLEWVTVHLMDDTGFTDEVVLSEIPARATVLIDRGSELRPGRPRAAVVVWVGTSP